jgi:hypothetical protein
MCVLGPMRLSTSYKAKFAQIGIFSTVNLFASEILLTKKLEIENN